ncbi:MAG: hypothetical protein ABSB14_07780 [Candidatus Sulfotelmatobacter sp.]|jgi:hypothetical protein
MDMTRSTTAAAAQPAKSVVPENDVPNSDVRNTEVRSTDVRNSVRNDLRNAVRHDTVASRKSSTSGYGMPCAKCRLYYAANLDTCPACNSKERVSPNVVPAIPKTQAAAEPLPDTAVVEQEREAFLEEFKSQLFAAHAEVTTSPVACTLGEHHGPGAEGASICKPCYDRLQERADVYEAALHIDLKEAAQIIYDAVWADPSDPSKTYTNAASALLSELRKRSGVSSLLGPFQPLGN